MYKISIQKCKAIVIILYRLISEATGNIMHKSVLGLFFILLFNIVESTNVDS